MYIGLHGPQEVGKDTIGRYLQEHYGFIQRSFAEPVYQCIEKLNPWICTCPKGERIQLIHYVRLMDVVDDMGWDEAKKNVPAVRWWLQRFATEACRDIVDPDIWVNTAEQRIRPYKARGHKDFVFTDVRFWNEAEWIQKSGKNQAEEVPKLGKTVIIVREGFEMKPEQHYASEAGLVDWEFDYVLESTSNLADVPRLVDSMMATFEVPVPHGR